PALYSLSLHDALPISPRARAALQGGGLGQRRGRGRRAAGVGRRRRPPAPPRARQARPACPRAHRLAARVGPPASESADLSTPSSARASVESGRWRGWITSRLRLMGSASTISIAESVRRRRS